MLSKDKKKESAKRISEILIAIGNKIQENPDLLDMLGISFEQIIEIDKEDKEKKKSIDLDLFLIFRKDGEDSLKEKLQSLSLSELKLVVSKNSFDPSKSASKWKKKDRIISLIIDRVKSRIEKGQVFKDYETVEPEKLNDSAENEGENS